MTELAMEGIWNSYRTQCIHPKASPEQLHEMKKSFMAGALSGLQLLLKLQDGVDDEEFALCLFKLIEELSMYGMVRVKEEFEDLHSDSSH